MSVPTPTPAGAPSTTLGTIKQLFERRLVGRVMELAETRWPGSGQMAPLANDWARLSPSAHRERLAAIGPTDRARMRRLVDLPPNLKICAE